MQRSQKYRAKIPTDYSYLKEEIKEIRVNWRSIPVLLPLSLIFELVLLYAFVFFVLFWVNIIQKFYETLNFQYPGPLIGSVFMITF
ncbi:unnamed protein product [Paramecium primaurelia]|uniref:Uncharacterized protein n=1 Tax=Paramecium primaurelia TaxID=5886 RepID=A0A8S1PH65_PARPR|nr:unnamed protein product [Paramecium primaurelia]